jgi:protein TonB
MQDAPSPIKPTARVRNYLAWSFALSLLVHLIVAPLARTLQVHEQAQEITYPLALSTRPPLRTIVPTPPPATPTPKPLPRAATTSAPPQFHRIVAVQTHTLGAGHSRPRFTPSAYTSPGVAVSPEAVVSAAATASAQPEPTKASCSQPHLDPRTENAVQPDYPDLAREQGASGTAEVRVTLDARGDVLSAVIEQGTGSTLLDNAAVAAAKASTFSPEIEDCLPVGGTYLFRADFSAQ